jgi:hypothetical protein
LLELDNNIDDVETSVDVLNVELSLAMPLLVPEL